jgi:hypothetical protein
MPDEDLSLRKDPNDPPAAAPSDPSPVSTPDSPSPSDPQGAPRDAGGGSRPRAAREEIEPLPYDGVASVAVGTLLWLGALIIMIPFADDLEASGRLWWLATAAVGFGLGLLGLVVVTRRRARLARRSRNDS